MHRPLPIQRTAFRVDDEHRPLYRRGGFHIRPWEYAAAQTPRRGQDRLAAHNERRQPAKLARSCGCLPRRGKHCSLPGFATLNRGPTLTTPHLPTIRRLRVPCRERSCPLREPSVRQPLPRRRACRGRIYAARRCTENGCSRSGPRAGHARPLPVQETEQK